MAIWWITEAIPIPATSLISIVLFPVHGDILMGKGEELVRSEIETLGPMKREGKIIARVFFLAAATWIVMGLVKIPLSKGVSDATVAVAAALADAFQNTGLTKFLAGGLARRPDGRSPEFVPTDLHVPLPVLACGGAVC